MARSFNISNPPQTWSSCSVAAINSVFSRVSNSLAWCLHNIPHPDNILGDAVCGDGIVQGDEVCDCGGPQVGISEWFMSISVRNKNLKSVEHTATMIYEKQPNH